MSSSRCAGTRCAGRSRRSPAPRSWAARRPGAPRARSRPRPAWPSWGLGPAAGGSCWPDHGPTPGGRIRWNPPSVAAGARPGRCWTASRTRHDVRARVRRAGQGDAAARAAVRRRRRRRPRGGRDLAPRTPASRRLVDRGAGDQCDDDRGARAAAALPRAGRAGRACGGGPPHSRRAARGRIVGPLLRGARGPEHDDRGIRGAPGARSGPGGRADAAGARRHPLARGFTKIWLALFGQYPWAGIPTIPPEIVYLPPFVPFNLYDFACWARGTIAPLTIVLAHRPVRPLGVALPEVVLEGTQGSLARVPGGGPLWWADAFLKMYERSPWKPGRAAARRRVVQWIQDRQEADGSWGGIQPPWVYSLIALALEGMGADHPVMRRGLEGMRRFSIDDADGWRFQACMSPVWDTAWALRALAAAGHRLDEPHVRAAVRWILAEQIDVPGDWAVRSPRVPCGGWAFEFDNDLYPDIDDTAVVVVALLESGAATLARDAIERARRWVLAMRSRGGAWGAFDRNNTRRVITRLPFCDFGAVLDPPSEDVTAHVVEMLGALGVDGRDGVVRDALRYLAATQQPGGAWWGRWGVNYIYGTWCVISGLAAVGAGPAMVARAAAWLLSVQQPDGGWGETCYSYEDASFAGVGRSTPSQTAWAVLALQLAGQGRHPACQRGLAFLAAAQRGGTWEEPEFTGTGFPRDFYINYHLYRHVFPMLALAHAAAAEIPAAPRERHDLLVR